MGIIVTMWRSNCVNAVARLCRLCGVVALGTTVLGCSEASESELSVGSASSALGAPLPSIVTSVLPADDAVDATTNGPLRLNLSQPVVSEEYNPGTISVRSADDGQLVAEMLVQKRHVVNPYAVEMWPTHPLELGGEYYVTISRRAVRVNAPPWLYIGDYTSYPNGDADDPTMWNFTVGVETSAPLPRVVTSVSPADDTTEVSANTPLTIHFSDPIWLDQWTGAIELHRADDGSLVERFVLDWSHVSSGNLSVTVTPTNPLELGTDYYMTFDRTATRINAPPWRYLGDYTGYQDGHANNPTMWNFSTCSDEPLTFADPALEAAVRDAVGKPNGELSCEDVADLTELRIHWSDISDLSGIERLGSLERLVLSSSRIADISPIGQLRNLRGLELRTSDVSDISPLTALTNLEALTLSYIDATDLSPLAALTNLQTLTISGSDATDLSPLAALTNLQTLTLVGNDFTDISPLATLANLQTLTLSYSDVADISPLAALTNLQTLTLAGDSFADISPLAAFARLESLTLNNTEVSDLHPLTGLTKLEYLNIERNDIVDISPLAGLTKLSVLLLRHNDVVDVSPLANLVKLTRLDLAYNGISDISPLAGLTQLTWLAVCHNEVVDISPLAGLSSLTVARLSYNQISDLSPLSNLIELDDLKLDQNQIRDLAPLVANPGLGDSQTDLVWVGGNPLDCDDPTTLEHIAEMRSRYFDFYTGC